jgi:hypothetical protein
VSGGHTEGASGGRCEQRDTHSHTQGGSH